MQHIASCSTLTMRHRHDGAAIDSTKIVPPGRYIVRAGKAGDHCVLIKDGLAQRNKIVARGARQILGLCTATQIADLHLLYLDRIDHNIQAVTSCEIMLIDREQLRAAVGQSPELRDMLWRAHLIDLAITREWQANIGRRNAAMRMAHLICELRQRLGDGDATNDEHFVMPLTQADLADVLGLTTVHINRVLRELEARGLVVREKRGLIICDWQALHRAADFNPAYLFGETRMGGLMTLLEDALRRVGGGGDGGSPAAPSDRSLSTV